MDDLREKVARALHDMHWTEEKGEEPTASWEGCVSSYRQEWFEQADEFLAATHASGHRIVPVEPTEEMMEAGLGESPTFGFNEPSDVAPVYRAMLTAYGQKDGGS